MRKYYVRYYSDFANTYHLRYAETPEQNALAISQGFERITLKDAIALCRRENFRRRYEPSSSGYGASVILPIDYDDSVEAPWECNRHYCKVGYVIQRV